jgi:predicted nucleic acid-binding protein
MYVVCSRPQAARGLGLTPSQAHQEIIKTRALFQLLPETSNVYSIWEGLVSRYNVSGKPAHDTRLVAMMIEHRVKEILTFNDADFKRFTEVAPLNPFDVLGLPRR